MAYQKLNAGEKILADQVTANMADTIPRNSNGDATNNEIDLGDAEHRYATVYATDLNVTNTGNASRFYRSSDTGDNPGAITWATDFDGLSVWSAGAPSHITFPKSGKLTISCVIRAKQSYTYGTTDINGYGGASGCAYPRLKKNGTTFIREFSITRDEIVSGSPDYHYVEYSLNTVISLTAGDYIEVLFQNGSGTHRVLGMGVNGPTQLNISPAGLI